MKKIIHYTIRAVICGKKKIFIGANFLINGLENLNRYGNASGFLQS